MDDSIRLSEEQRKELLIAYRSGKDARVSRRAHIVLLLAEGWTHREVRAITFASFDLIQGCIRGLKEKGVAAVVGTEPSQPTLPRWLRKVVQWLTKRSPQDFGFFRSRWSCELLAETLAWESGERLSGETIRRGGIRVAQAATDARPE